MTVGVGDKSVGHGRVGYGKQEGLIPLSPPPTTALPIPSPATLVYTSPQPSMHHSSHTLPKPLTCLPIVVLLPRSPCTVADLVFLFLSLPLCAPPTQLGFP